MFKVTNKFKDVRKFRDQHLGADIYVQPKKSVLTKKPPMENEVWKVEKIEEKLIKKIKKGDSNDSSNSR